MICSEHKVLVEQGRYPVERWQKIAHHRANHYLDCEVYCAVAGDIMNVRWLSEEAEEEEEEENNGVSFTPNFNPYGRGE